MSSDEDQLRRELRAMAAVNQQLQARLDEPAATPVRPRRAQLGTDWIEELVRTPAAEPSLVRTRAGKVFVVEGDAKRPVGAGIIAAALEQSMGRSREVSESELDGLRDSAPVEIFEAPDGPPFVVLGRKRCRVRGIPLSHPVSNKQASEFPQGDDVDVSAANVSRLRYQDATSAQFQMGRLREAVAKKGLVGTSKAVARRVRRRLRG